MADVKIEKMADFSRDKIAAEVFEKEVPEMLWGELWAEEEESGFAAFLPWISLVVSTITLLIVIFKK